MIDIAQESGEFYLCVRLRAGSYAGRHDGKVYATAHRDLGFSLEEIAVMNYEKLHSRQLRGMLHGSGDNR